MIELFSYKNCPHRDYRVHDTIYTSYGETALRELLVDVLKETHCYIRKFGYRDTFFKYLVKQYLHDHAEINTQLHEMIADFGYPARHAGELEKPWLYLVYRDPRYSNVVGALFCFRNPQDAMIFRLRHE